LSLAQTFFNRHISQVIAERKEKGIKEIGTARNKDIKTLLFADDKVIAAGSGDALQISVHKLETVTFKCGLKISTSKTKTMIFKGRDSVRSKLVKVKVKVAIEQAIKAQRGSRGIAVPFL